MRRSWKWLSVCLVPLLTYPLGSAGAHDHYTNWQRPDGKGSCCNTFDCRPVAHRDAPGGVEVRVDELGGWYRVPTGTVLPFGSPDAGAHACYVLVGCQSTLGCRPHFYCVALPLTN